MSVMKAAIPRRCCCGIGRCCSLSRSGFLPISRCCTSDAGASPCTHVRSPATMSPACISCEAKWRRALVARDYAGCGAGQAGLGEWVSAERALADGAEAAEGQLKLVLEF